MARSQHQPRSSTFTMRTAILLYALTYVHGSVYDEYDPKENYFRYMRAFEDHDLALDTPSDNVPKPGGFNTYNADRLSKLWRIKREDATEKESDLELGKPLELSELDTENVTEISDVKNDLIINDFIRFRRDAERVESGKETGKYEKMLMSTGDVEGNREPRGATKDQWIKQPYPVHTTNPNPNSNRSDRRFEDNSAAGSENAASRAPRVHFVTQRRSEAAPPLIYHSYEREGRSRDSDRDLGRDMADNGYYPRPPRHYNSPQNYPYRRPDAYYFRGDWGRQPIDYPLDKYYEEDRPVPAIKQKRIIYYATLPEVVRTPPNVDLRDRYNYRDRFDNRYISSQPVSVSGTPENYKHPNGNPYGKSRYDDPKIPYPLKVSSTDVNVREIKKNPEMRIYSDADRRYSHKGPPYRAEDGPYDRNF